MSITRRLILALTLGVTLLWCAAAAYSGYESYHELNEAFDRTLEQAARSLMPLAVDDILGHGNPHRHGRGLGHDAAKEGDHENEDHEHEDGRALEHFARERKLNFSYQVRDSAGKVALRSHDAPVDPYDHAPAQGFTTFAHYRLFTEVEPVSGISVSVAETLNDREKAIRDSVQALMLPVLALIPLTVLGIWLIVRGAMRPVARLSRDISQRGSRNLAPLDAAGQPAELRPIAESVGHLLERLRAALDAERAFAANSAHELRTPIAGALAQTQRLIAESRTLPDKQRAGEIETTLKKLSNLAEKLMQLSRVDAGLALTAKTVDLVPVIKLVAQDCAARLTDPSRIILQLSPDFKLNASLDMDAFAIVLRNLIDNAVLHGAEGGKVDITGRQNGVSVVNSGLVVSPEVLHGLTQRFVRGQSRSSGSGLGLAIAETILSQSGGKLELFSPAPGRTDGFEARVTLAG